MIKITIESVGRDSLRKTGNLFDVSHETVLDIKEAQKLLIERYGKMPGGRNKIYIDDKDGNAKVLGFTHSFWNNDISHNNKSWYQTDWITAVYVEEAPVNILLR